MNNISIADVFLKGWINTRKHLGFLTLSTFIYILIHLILVGSDRGHSGGLLSILTIAVGTIFSIGMLRMSLLVESGGTPRADDFKVGIGLFFTFIWASIISGFFSIVGLVFLIIPGIIIAVRLSFVKYIVIDRNLSAWQSVKLSWQETKGFSWKIFAFILLSGIIVFVSALPFGLGLLVSIPFVSMSFAVFYRKIILSKTVLPSGVEA